MAAYTVKLPDVGEGIAQAEIVSWHVAVGDRIREDDVIAEIMTDKATVELPSPVAGTIAWLGGEVGDILSIGADLLRIETSIETSLETSVAVPVAGASDIGAPSSECETSEPTISADPLLAKPQIGSGPLSLASVMQAGGKLPAEPEIPSAHHVRAQAAPAVRERARRLGIELSSLRGSGPGGRVIHHDLDDAIMKRRDLTRDAKSSGEPRDGAPSSATPTAQPQASFRSPDELGAPAGLGAHARSPVAESSARFRVLDSHLMERDHAPQVERIKIIGLRRNIAERMQLSKRRIPHFTYVEEIDVTELERLRQQLNSSTDDRFKGSPRNQGVSPVNEPEADFAGGLESKPTSNPTSTQTSDRIKLTVLPFIMRAVVKGLVAYPQMNARFDDDAGVLERHSDIRLGIAVQTAKGLMVPVVKGMRTLDLWESAAEVSRLAQLARSSKIKIEDLVGSTITITSLGTLGGIMSTPVINYPEVAVIGVNKIVERPVYLEGALVPRKIMNLSSSFDHRVIDGADAAAFIQAIKGLLETPALLFV
jgi:2-oxoisovalerate dehydrogenase E2 component (dihydrolipoyl transacylase)